MPTERDASPTNDTLAERIEATRERIAALDKLMGARFDAVGETLAERRHADDYNRAQANEWRGALNDLGEKMASKTELAAIVSRVNLIDSTVTAMPSRADIDQRLSDVAERISKAEARGYTAQGTESQRQESKATTLTVASIIAIVLSAIVGATSSVVVHNLFQGLK